MSSFLLALGTSLLSGASPVHSLTLGRSASTPFSWISPPVPARGNHLLPGGGGARGLEGFWGAPAEALCPTHHLLCSPADSRHTGGGGGPCKFKEGGDAGGSHLGAPLSAPASLSFPHPHGRQGLVQVHASVTFRRVLSVGSEERKRLLHCKLSLAGERSWMVVIHSK